MKKIAIAIIGTGHLGAIHAKLIAQNHDIHFAGIYDTDLERAQTIAQSHGTHAFQTTDELLNNADAIIIAAPTSVHHPLAMKAINAKKHCFIEKPITTTFAEAEEIILVAQDNNVVVQVGHVERFNPALTALHPYHINPMFIEAHRLAQFKPRATDVSVVHDLMIHDIDIALSLVKSPIVSVEASGVAVLTETADIANARLKFMNGCVANITASRISAQPMRKMRLFQKDGYFSIDFAKGSVDAYRILDRGSNTNDFNGIPATMLGSIESGTVQRDIIFEQPPTENVNAIAEEHKSFVQAINGDRHIAVTATDAAEALRIAEVIAANVYKA